MRNKKKYTLKKSETSDNIILKWTDYINHSHLFLYKIIQTTIIIHQIKTTRLFSYYFFFNKFYNLIKFI